jgi:type IV pilus assembly protein PilA
MTEDNKTQPPPPYPTYGQPQPARRPAWFWILIIGGCCAAVIFVLLIIAAVAIPSMLRMRKVANQTAAIQTLRAITQAELVYSVSSYPDSGFGCPLSVLGGDPKSGAPTAQAAQLLPADLAATGQKSGYTFTVTCGSKTTINNQDVYNSVEIFGVPQAVGKTGDNGYCSDENNIVKVDPAGGTNCTQSSQ